MLRRVGETVDSKDAVVKIKDASFPTPFVSALEYNSPVHGNWNIVHTGMQVPEYIQICLSSQYALSFLSTDRIHPHQQT